MPSQACAEPPPRRGETVLIVEDEDALREVTRRILTRKGYTVITAANGAEAITAAASYEGTIHLLLTDVVMPQMLGKEVAEKIRQIRPDIGCCTCPATPSRSWPRKAGSTRTSSCSTNPSPNANCSPRSTSRSPATWPSTMLESTARNRHQPHNSECAEGRRGTVGRRRWWATLTFTTTAVRLAG